MKLPSSRLEILLPTVCMLVFFGYAHVEGGQWKVYHVSESAFYLYDVDSVVEYKEVVRVSEKSVCRKTKKITLKEALEAIGATEKNTGQMMDEESRKTMIDTTALQETMRLIEIRCSRKIYRVVSGVYRDRDGTVIDGIAPSKWDDVERNPTTESLYKVVCNPD